MKVLILLLCFLGFISCSGNLIASKESCTQNTKVESEDTLLFKSGIRAILHDRKGNYWIGSDNEGVCLYSLDSFRYFTVQDGLSSNQILSIQEDETGVVWFETNKGVCYYDGNRVLKLQGDIGHSGIINESIELKPWSTEYDDLWFSAQNRGELLRIAKGTPSRVKSPIKIPFNANPINFDISCFSKSKKGGLWIGYYSGATFYNGKELRILNDSSMGYNGESMYMHVRSIFEDSKGRVWIGNNGIGVQLFIEDSVSHFSSELKLVKGSPFGTKSPSGTLMHVFSITEDKHGNIWFGDRDTGVWRFDGTEMQHFDLDTKLTTQHIWAIHEDRMGNLLFASADRGIYKFNGRSFDRFF